jgi:hypothetical protein
MAARFRAEVYDCLHCAELYKLLLQEFFGA